MFFDNSEMEREAWRHQQCAEYLRSQLQTQVPHGASPQPHGYPAGSSGYSPTSYGGQPQQQPRYAPPGAGGLQPPALQPSGVAGGPGGVPNQDKVWKTFNDLDTNRNGRIELEELGRGLGDINLDLTWPTIQDLYRKVKRSGELSDGITNAEWGNFCERYPMLRDAIYFRFLAKQNADAELKDAQAQQGELARNRERARQEAAAAEREAKAERDAAGREDLALGEAENAQRAAEDQSTAAEGAAREAAKARDAAHARVQREWPVIQKRQAERYAAQQDAELARRRIGEQEERERMLQQALDDARCEKDRAHAALRDAIDREAASRAPDGEPDPEEEFRNAERSLAEAHRDDQDARAAVGDARNRTDRQRGRRDEQDRRAEQAEQRKEAADGGLDRASRAVEDNDRRITNAKGTQQMGPGKNPDGSMTEDGEKENELIKDEIRLREQRDQLEQREGALREEHTSWSNPRQEAYSQNPRMAGSPYRGVSGR